MAFFEKSVRDVKNRRSKTPNLNNGHKRSWLDFFDFILRHFSFICVLCACTVLSFFLILLSKNSDDNSFASKYQNSRDCKNVNLQQSLADFLMENHSILCTRFQYIHEEKLQKNERKIDTKYNKQSFVQFSQLSKYTQSLKNDFSYYIKMYKNRCTVLLLRYFASMKQTLNILMILLKVVFIFIIIITNYTIIIFLFTLIARSRYVWVRLVSTLWRHRSLMTHTHENTFAI